MNLPSYITRTVLKQHISLFKGSWQCDANWNWHKILWQVKWFCYLCVLTQKNSPNTQNNLWYASSSTQRSIDGSEDVFVEYVCVISVAVVKQRLFPLVFVVLYNRRSIIIFVSVNCNTEFGVWLQTNCVVTRPRDSMFFFNWDSTVLEWDSWFFTRGVPGLTITICNKISASSDQMEYLSVTWELFWPKQ